MAFDAFLVFTAEPGQQPVQGESQDPQFATKHPVAIRSFSLGLANTIQVGSQTGGVGAGKAQFQEFKISKLVDRTSPVLFQLAANGTHLQQLDLYLRKGKLIFLQFSFKLVFVATIDWSGSNGDETPVEEVTFKYGAMQLQYAQQTTTGQATTYKGSWNQITNSTNMSIPGEG